jgi:hypothetical protein
LSVMGFVTHLIRGRRAASARRPMHYPAVTR